MATSPPPESPPHYSELYEDPRIYERRWFLLGVLCLCLVMIVMAVAGLNVAIPEMQSDMDASATDLSWIVDSYAIVFAGLLLSAGAIGDRFGRKTALQGGLVAFAAGSILGALVDSPSGVIVARVVMGAGAAFIMPATLSIITAIFPPHERSKAIAVWAGFAGAGGALGPLVVGGLLTGIDFGIFQFGPYWWGSAFLANLIAIVPTLIAVSIFSPQSKDSTSRPLDPVGALFSMIAISTSLYAIIEGPTEGWTSSIVLGGFAIGVVFAVAFILWEARSRHPMLPLSFFRDRRFTVGSGVITVAFMAMFGFFFLASQYLQFVKGYSPLRAGAATLPAALMFILVAPRSARLADTYGFRRAVGFASFISAAGFGLMALLESDSTYWLFAAALVVMAIGQGMIAPPATTAIMSSVPLNQAGVGSAVNDTTRELGGAFGIAILGSIVTSAYRGSVELDGLSAADAEVARESVGGAWGVAQRIGGTQGQQLLDDAGRAFTTRSVPQCWPELAFLCSWAWSFLRSDTATAMRSSLKPSSRTRRSALQCRW